MKKRLQEKVEYLRNQPEHVRYRATAYGALVGGSIVTALWLVIFLPLQLFFQARSDQDADSSETLVEENIAPLTSSSPQVGGLLHHPPSSSSIPSVLSASPSSSPTPELPAPEEAVPVSITE